MRYFLLGILIASFSFAAFTWYDFHTSGPLAEEKIVFIPRGTGFRAATDLLAQEGIIARPFFFNAMAVMSGKARKFKAGEYAFTPNVTPEQVMAMLVGGQVVVHKITVPEGWRAAEVIDLLTKETKLTGTMTMPPEGSLLPETYYFLRGDERQDVMNRMQADMAKLVAELWSKRKEGLPYQAGFQAVVLASIVEKETSTPEERPRIAAVFLNRLRKNMPLQSDPTVQYAIEKDKGPMKQALTLADLKYNSPYNTYIYGNLPPTPISNPGRAALEAVLNPPETNDLYFVATGTGGHYFSSTIAEHNKNVKKYREELKRQEKR